jgi:hypothetical protein
MRRKRNGKHNPATAKAAYLENAPTIIQNERGNEMTFLEATLKAVTELVDFGEVLTDTVEKDRCFSEGTLSAPLVEIAAGASDDSQHIIPIDDTLANKFVH